MKLIYININKIFFTFFLIFYLTNNNLSFAEENTSCKFNFDNKIEKIKININKNKQWTKNNIKILISNTKIIPEKFKKRYSGDLNIKYKDGSLCKLKAKIRQNGDFRDHIFYQDNKIFQSLDIKLLNGNFANITNFKLLLDGTRGISEDEIFLTETLRILNYIAPRTKFINVEINGTTQKMLFQEKSRKELLEFHNRTESSIIEANERDLFKSLEEFKNNNQNIYEIGLVKSSKYNSLGTFVKQLNSTWFLKSNIHAKISYKALSKLNLIYSNSIDYFKNDKNDYYFNDQLSNLNLGGLKKENIIRLEKYNLILRLFNAEHALNAHNRKFYWNNTENYFEPIYYDGNPNIFRFLENKNNFQINIYTKTAIDQLKKDLDDLDYNEFRNIFFDKNVDFLNSKIKEKIAILKYNLSKIDQEYEKFEKKGLEFETPKKFGKKIIKNSIKYKMDRNKNAIFLFKNLDDKNQNKFLICKEYENCKEIELSFEKQAKLVEGNLFKNSKEYIFVGEFNFDEIYNDLKNFNQFKTKDKKINFYYDNGIEFDFDKLNGNFLISQIEPEARAYFFNSNLENLNIEFNGLITNDKLKFFPIDQKGITGCLAFYKSNFKDTSLKIQNSNCEDSLNLVRSEGRIDKIEIFNSHSDGLDIDFSNLKIANVIINNSKNDCMDVSLGAYLIQNIKVSSCGDKGLSVGEKSSININKISIINSVIGIATKDGSISHIKNAEIKNVETCMEAYNKKQEFSGGKIIVNKYNCNNFTKKNLIDNQSNITFNN